MPGGLLVFLSGAALIILGSRNLFTALWLDVAIGLLLINFVLALGLGRSQAQEMLRLAERLEAAPRDGETKERMQALGQRASGIGLLGSISLILIIFLMAAKPF